MLALLAEWDRVSRPTCSRTCKLLQDRACSEVTSESSRACWLRAVATVCATWDDLLDSVDCAADISGNDRAAARFALVFCAL